MKQNRSFTRPLVVVATTIAIGLATAGVAVATSDHRPSPSPVPGAVPPVITAHMFAKVAPPESIPGALPTTLLESPVFGPDGQLWFVDLTAPTGKPKVSELNLKTKKLTTVHTDDTSTISSIQFSPADGKAYLTDLFQGKVYRMNPDGTGFTTVFSGPIDGRASWFDDITFDQDGNMYASDTSGTPWSPTGRVVRFDKTGANPSVLIDGLAGANGVSFSPDYSTLWVSESSAGREDHFTLSADKTSVVSGGIGMTANVGTDPFDSNAVDTDGNIYQCQDDGGRVLVYNTHGDQIATIVVPQNLPKPQMGSTNLAIEPGTTQGYLTVGGENGGYIYRFNAVGIGGTQSNGGSATSRSR